MHSSIAIQPVEPLHKAVQKWGNSLGIRISSLLAKQAKLTAGSTISMAFENDAIVIKKVANDTPFFTEQALLANLTPHSAHADELAMVSNKELYPWLDDDHRHQRGVSNG